MAYKAGKRPIERASKIAHSNIINKELIKQFLQRCKRVPQLDTISEGMNLNRDIYDDTQSIKYLFTVDSGRQLINMDEFRDDYYPDMSIAYITVGCHMLALDDLTNINNRTYRPKIYSQN